MSDIPESGNCYKCRIELGKEFYCYGCKEFICDGCPESWSAADVTRSNTHEPDDHFIAAEDTDSLDEKPEW